MRGIARRGDRIEGGVHCHGGHSHPPPASPGRIVGGARKVFVNGRPAARAGDSGYSPLCCAGIGRISIREDQMLVWIEGKPAAGVGTPTMHCDVAPGRIATGSTEVRMP